MKFASERQPYSVLRRNGKFNLSEADPHSKSLDFNFFEVKEVSSCQTFYDQSESPDSSEETPSMKARFMDLFKQ